MSKQNIFIINFNLLYEILNEIKENLPFKIIKCENDDNFIRIFSQNTENYVIIDKTKNNLLLNKKVSEKNFLHLDNLPLSLNKLVELINIQLIKLKFSHQSKIDVKGYELNLNSKFFSRDHLSLKLTEKETKLILYLNEAKKKYDVLDLQKNIWSYSSEMETHTVETHIHRLRKKISDKFNDKNFILSDKDGYFI